MEETGNSVPGQERPTSVIAIAQQEKTLRAVKLVRQGDRIELAWARSQQADDGGMMQFARSCGLEAGGASGEASEEIVAGFDTAAVVFYQMEVPAVKRRELDAIVRLQAESRLPLSADQMEVAWRGRGVHDGRVMVTVAGAKRRQLEGFARDVGVLKPSRILLNNEAVAKVWRSLFSGGDEPAVVVSVGSLQTQLCLVQGGALANAVSLDVGTYDWESAENDEEKIEVLDRFCQDVNSVLELFGYRDARGAPIFVLSDGEGVSESVVQRLKLEGLNATAAVPDMTKLSNGGAISAGDVYEYHIPIGLGLIALEGDVEELGLFERVYQRPGLRLKKRWYHSLKITGATAVATAVLAVVVSYVALSAKSSRLAGLVEANPGLQEAIQRVELLKTVARQRVDLPGLLELVNQAEHEGVMLDRFEYARGRPVRISGQAKEAEQAYKFQKSLEKLQDISNVEMPVSKSEEKGIRFDITFHYKHFTRRVGGP